MELWEPFARMLIGLGLLIAILIGLLMLLRTLRPDLVQHTGAPIITTLDTHAVGPKQTVQLVAILGQFHILAITPTSLTHLGTITDPEQIRQLTEHLKAKTEPSASWPPWKAIATRLYKKDQP